MVHIAAGAMAEHQRRDWLGYFAIDRPDAPIPDAKREPSQRDLGQFTNRLDDRSYQAILQGFFNTHPVVAVGVLSNSFQRLSCLLGNNLVNSFACF